MTKTIQATFDGKVFKPDEPISLAPNTRVQITITSDEIAERPPQSFLQTAEALNLVGPADWSVRVDDYLYGDRIIPDE